ncbi:CRISPR-associated RAMP Cmr4 family protein, partial [Clostridium botulinum CFSAN001627]
MNNLKMFIMENITNMHVGNGDINFNIIDNEVQRDVITNFPTINPSSLKGSFREFCKNNLDEDEVTYIFGDKDTGIGKYKFFGASLLSMPVRSNVKPFFRATCPLIIREFLDTAHNFCSIKEMLDINEIEIL